LAAFSIDGVNLEVGGVLILRDGIILGGDFYVYYTGTTNAPAASVPAKC
jgi:hypothetical protein